MYKEVIQNQLIFEAVVDFSYQKCHRSFSRFFFSDIFNSDEADDGE